ncbi:MAG TPA: hypothetical protein VFT95_01170, partial [Micromonosporaceae bacterium]|nr:hypothetical protein [Micromonosporaceae bacterium]
GGGARRGPDRAVDAAAPGHGHGSTGVDPTSAVLLAANAVVLAVVAVLLRRRGAGRASARSAERS